MGVVIFLVFSLFFSYFKKKDIRSFSLTSSLSATLTCAVKLRRTIDVYRITAQWVQTNGRWLQALNARYGAGHSQVETLHGHALEFAPLSHKRDYQAPPTPPSPWIQDLLNMASFWTLIFLFCPSRLTDVYFASPYACRVADCSACILNIFICQAHICSSWDRR